MISTKNRHIPGVQIHHDPKVAEAAVIASATIVDALVSKWPFEKCKDSTVKVKQPFNGLAANELSEIRGSLSELIFYLYAMTGVDTAAFEASTKIAEWLDGGTKYYLHLDTETQNLVCGFFSGIIHGAQSMTHRSSGAMALTPRARAAEVISTCINKGGDSVVKLFSSEQLRFASDLGEEVRRILLLDDRGLEAVAEEIVRNLMTRGLHLEANGKLELQGVFAGIIHQCDFYEHQRSKLASSLEQTVTTLTGRDLSLRPAPFPSGVNHLTIGIEVP